jgi:hypothetical protein
VVTALTEQLNRRQKFQDWRGVTTQAEQPDLRQRSSGIKMIDRFD